MIQLKKYGKPVRISQNGEYIGTAISEIIGIHDFAVQLNIGFINGQKVKTAKILGLLMLEDEDRVIVSYSNSLPPENFLIPIIANELKLPHNHISMV